MSKADAVKDLRKPPGERDSAAHLTIWQVNFADDQILELTQAEIQQDLVAGNLSRDNYVWREGMATWLPIADVPEFAQAASIAPPSGFRPRPDDEVETVPLDPEDDEQTVALKSPSFLAGYERSAPTLEFSIDGDAETAEPPTTRAPAVTPSALPSRMDRSGDKTPAYGSVPPTGSVPLATSSAPPAVSRSSAPAAILLRGSAPPEAVVKSSAPPASAPKVSPSPSVRITSQPVPTRIPSSPIITPPAAPKATLGAESPPPLPSRKPVIPVSTSSSPTSAPRPEPTPAPEQPARARGSVFPPPSPGAELVAPRPVPQAELAAPKPMPAEPLVATPVPPPVFEDPGLLPPEEMKSDAVWPAPDPALARRAAQAAETPLPLRQRVVVAAAPVVAAPVPPLQSEPAAADPPPTRESDEAQARKEAEAARPRPIGNEPLVIVAGPSETLPPSSPTNEPEKPARDLTPKPGKSAPPIVMKEAQPAKAQLVDIKSSDLMNESTLITGRRRTKHWVSMTNAIIGAVCLAAIASALTALVMQATELSRARHAPPAVAVVPPPAQPQPAAAPVAVTAEKLPEPAPTASAAAAPGEPVVAPSPLVTPEPKPEVTPEAPVAAKPASPPAAKRRPPQKASSTNPYDDIVPSKSESAKRAPAKTASDDGTGIPSNPGF